MNVKNKLELQNLKSELLGKNSEINKQFKNLGSLSEDERKNILDFEGVNRININENILRAETAAISTLSILNYYLNL